MQTNCEEETAKVRKSKEGEIVYKNVFHIMPAEWCAQWWVCSFIYYFIYLVSCRMIADVNKSESEKNF